MADENENVPRRLRRFLRKGEPIPEKLLPKTIPENEPWNQPAVTAQARSNISVSSKAAEVAMKPKHRGARFQEMQQNSFSPQSPGAMDKALGLENKSQLQDRLPSSGNKAIEMKKDEIQKALDEIKKYKEPAQAHSADTLDQMAEHIVAQNKESAQSQEQSNSSFHFTPIASAPNPVDAKKLNAKNSEDNASAAEQSNLPASAIPADQLSPRERMEQRRQQRGQPIPPSTQTSVSSETRKDMSTTTISANSSTRTHIRRRAGQVDENATDSMNENSDMASSDAPAGKSDEDFKDLFDEEKPSNASATSKKKKEKKSAAEEDMDFDADEDMELLEDEGK